MKTQRTEARRTEPVGPLEPGPSIRAALANMPKYEFDAPKSLSLEEKLKLDKFERVIEKGLKTFEEVGEALVHIRDGLLYRQTHGSFEDYCQARWQIGARRARQLATSAEVMKTLKEPTASEPQKTLPNVLANPEVETHIVSARDRFSEGEPISLAVLQTDLHLTYVMAGKVYDAMVDRGFVQNFKFVEKGNHGSGPEGGTSNIEHRTSNVESVLPKGERQIRPLARLPKEEQKEAWKEAVATAPNGQVTGRHVEEVVQRRLAPELPMPEVRQTEPKPEVLRLAQHLYAIAMKAAGLSKPWAKGAHEIHLAFLAVAEWHRGEMVKLQGEIEALKEANCVGATIQKKTSQKATKGTKWPKPNAHGVYDDKDAVNISFKCPHARAEILLLELSKGWVFVANFQYDTGDCVGNHSPLKSEPPFLARNEALRRALKSLIRSNSDLTKRRHGCQTPAQQAAARKIVAWAEKELKGLQEPAAKLSGYVIYREPATGQKNNKLRFGPGWGHDPNKGTIYPTLELAKTAAANGWAAVMSLQKATDRFEKSK